MRFTAQEIAAFAGGVVDGNPAAEVSAFAKIEEGKAGDLTFLANPKYTEYIYLTHASIVLVKNDFVAEHPISATLVRVADPYATLALLLQKVSQMTRPVKIGIDSMSQIADGVEIPDDVYIGAFAVVSTGAVIGEGVKIYPQVWVGDNVTIGSETVLYPGVKIYPGCRIGSRCVIHAGAVIGADGFGFAPTEGHYEKIPQIGIVEIGDDVEIGANTTVDRATMGATRIADGVKLDNLIQVAHNCTIDHDTVIAAQTGIAGSTKVGARCMIGGQVGFAGHISVGDGTVVGAQTGVNSHVERGSRLMGYPATDYNKWLRQQVDLRRLPELKKQIQQLAATIEKLERQSESNPE